LFRVRPDHAIDSEPVAVDTVIGIVVTSRETPILGVRSRRVADRTITVRSATEAEYVLQCAALEGPSAALGCPQVSEGV